MEKPKISYSNLKSIYTNLYELVCELDTIPTNPKSIFVEFLNDPQWIESYTESLQWDVDEMEDDDHPIIIEHRQNYERYIKELKQWLNWLES